MPSPTPEKSNIPVEVPVVPGLKVTEQLNGGSTWLCVQVWLCAAASAGKMAKHRKRERIRTFTFNLLARLTVWKEMGPGKPYGYRSNGAAGTFLSILYRSAGSVPTTGQNLYALQKFVSSEKMEAKRLNGGKVACLLGGVLPRTTAGGPRPAR